MDGTRLRWPEGISPYVYWVSTSTAALAALAMLVAPAGATSVPACPPPDDVFNLAVAYWTLLWARMGCEGIFEAEVEAAELRSGLDEGSCEVVLRRPSGQLRMVLAKDVAAGPGALEVPGALEAFAVAAAIRRSWVGPWEEPSERLCLLSNYVGSTPMRFPAGSEMQSFAITALNTARAAEGCGTALVPEAGAPLAPARSAILERTIEVKFPLHLCSESAPGPCHGDQPSALILVALEVDTRWNRITRSASKSLRFLGTDPAPCAAGDLYATKGPGHWMTLVPQLPVPLQARGQLLALGEDDGSAVGLENLRIRAQALAQEALSSRGKHAMPQDFDYREEWPMCAGAESTPRAQGLCVSSWAAAAVGAWEKQACALSKGLVRARLSVQQVLDCGSRVESSAGCSGGRVQDAIQLLYTQGVVSEACAPTTIPPRPKDAPASDIANVTRKGMAAIEVGSFMAPAAYRMHEIEDGACRHVTTQINKKAAECPRFFARGPTVEEQAINAFTTMPGPLSGVVEGMLMIQAAILAYGAVVSLVEAYVDFIDYVAADGVYRRAQSLGPEDCLGLMAVQILGWGVTAEQTPYWIGEASFGTDWGMGGFFRWVRGDDHLGIESGALHPFVSGLAPPGFGGDGAGAGRNVAWKDRLSDLEGEESRDEKDLATQHARCFWLVLANVAGVVVTACAGLWTCVYLRWDSICETVGPEGWVPSAPSSARQFTARRFANGYAPVPASADAAPD